MLKTLKTLCYLSGVSGDEDEVRDYILEHALPHASEIKTDAMGNILIFKKGAREPGKKIMLCAHMDEVGLIITGFADDGYLRFSCVGGIDRRVLVGKRVYVGRSRVTGVISTKAAHLVSSEEEKKVPKLDDMLIDIGCLTKETAQDIVSVGDYCSFDDVISEMGDGYLKAKAVDDRVGCAVMLKLIESELPCDTWFAFTVQEEVGTRGAMVAANAISPDVCLILEGTTATDLPGVSDGKKICCAGDGVVIPFMDGGTIYDRGVTSMLTAAAEKEDIKWQTKHRIAGGTDASAIQKSLCGVRVGAASVAVRNIHSPSSLVKLSECEDLLRLASSFLRSFAF